MKRRISTSLIISLPLTAYAMTVIVIFNKGNASLSDFICAPIVGLIILSVTCVLYKLCRSARRCTLKKKQ